MIRNTAGLLKGAAMTASDEKKKSDDKAKPEHRRDNDYEAKNKQN